MEIVWYSAYVMDILRYNILQLMDITMGHPENL